MNVGAESTEVAPPAIHEGFMSEAIRQAQRALNSGEVPVGCVFVRDGKVIGEGYNRTNELKSGTMHAEVVCIEDILLQTSNFAATRNCDVYVTCEPCIMCAAALSFAGVRHVYFGCHNDRFGGNGSILNVHENGLYGLPSLYTVTPGILKEEAINLFRQFYSQENGNAPEAKRRKKDRDSKT